MTIPPVDVIYVSGVIYTVDPAQPKAEAVAIRDGKFAAVGSNREIQALAGPETQVVDLQGAFVMPGLYDMHLHPDLGLAPQYDNHLIVPQFVPTPDELKAEILAYAAAHPGDGWIRGEAWERYPFRQAGVEAGAAWLDGFMPDRPVALIDRSRHNLMVNTRAMELAGITQETRDLSYGYLERDDITGEPTGIFIDGAATLIHTAMPEISQAAFQRAYGETVQRLSAYGVVGAKFVHVDENRLNAIKYLDEDGRLSLRVEAAISWKNDIFLVRRRWELMAGERLYYRSNRLSADAIKFHFDGVGPARSSYLMQPYPGESDWRGSLNLTPEEVIDTVVEMDRRGIRVIAHCTGDGSAHLFLNAVEAARRANGPNGVRHQMAHSNLIAREDYGRFHALNVICEFSPTFWYMSEFVEAVGSLFGDERLSRSFDINGIVQAGGMAVRGSDWPVNRLNPWFALQTMVTREDPTGELPGAFGEPVPLAEAIKIFTINGAWAMDMEDVAGSIQAGKWADMIVLDRNLLEIPADEIKDIQVQGTILEGKPVYIEPETLAALQEEEHFLVNQFSMP